MITNIRKNIMGTASFDGQFAGMRKPQDFIVYPMQDSGEQITIQSDSRFGRLNLGTGELALSTNKKGANSVTLLRDMLLKQQCVEILPGSDVQALRAGIKATGGLLVGESFIHSDNTGAMAL